MNCLSFALLLLLLMLNASKGQQQSLFVPMASEENIPQSAESLLLGPECPPVNIRVPHVMFTVEPHNETNRVVEVATFPANLLTVSGNDKVLEFAWNTDVAKATTEAGVHIRMPANQLQEVKVRSGAQAQFWDGFTDISTLQVSSAASLYGNFTTINENQVVSLRVSSGAKAYVSIPQGSLTEVKTSSAGMVQVEAFSIDTIKASSGSSAMCRVSSSSILVDVSSGASVELQGSVEIVDVSSGAHATVYENVTDNVEVSSGASIRIGDTLSGVGKASSGATISATSCDGVETRSGSTCIVTDPMASKTLTIQVPLQPAVLKGTQRCVSWRLFRAGFWVGIGLIILVIVVAVKCCIRRRRSRRSKAASPEDPPIAEAMVLAYVDDGTGATRITSLNANGVVVVNAPEEDPEGKRETGKEAA